MTELVAMKASKFLAFGFILYEDDPILRSSIPMSIFNIGLVVRKNPLLLSLRGLEKKEDKKLLVIFNY